MAKRVKEAMPELATTIEVGSTVWRKKSCYQRACKDDHGIISYYFASAVNTQTIDFNSLKPL
jgi:hypothetical protein